MAPQTWRHALVLGGIRSGKSELAEALVGDAPAVRYVATARAHTGPLDDPDWTARIAAHRARRSPAWSTVELGERPLDLAELLRTAERGQSLLIEDLGTWLAAAMEVDETDPRPRALGAELAAAVRSCPARVVLVSPEVGLSVVPASAAGRAFADAIGAVNQAVAGECDTVALVVAGQPSWLKGGPGARPGFGGVSAGPAPGTLITVQPTVDPLTPAPGAHADIRPGLSMPVPDDAAATAARTRLATLSLRIPIPTVTALGSFTDAVTHVAGAQGTAYPRPFLSTRTLLFTGAHAGGVSAGPVSDARTAIPLHHLAATAATPVVTLEWQPAAGPIEEGDAITPDELAGAMRAGWAEADRAADEGIELLILAAGGAGSATAAIAIIAAITGAEPAGMLPRVSTPDGRFDDEAWIVRCLALRDALHRVRDRDGDPRTVLSALGGADLAAATGLLLGAASRRTPVLVDGPVGLAAALAARDFAPQSVDWVLLPDYGRQRAVRIAAEALALRPWLDLGLDLGEGTTALAALPLLQLALTLAGAGVEPAAATPTADG